MSKMTLVLHIGTEKTGTTMIQKWLYQNRRNLMEQGVFLSEKLGWENNRELVAYYRTQPDEFWTFNSIENVEDKKRHFTGFISDIEAEIEGASRSNHTMIITSEHFHSRLTDESDIANFSDFCRRNFKDHIVICYLRPQWEVRRSLYSTDLRNNEQSLFRDYRSDVGPNDEYFNYLDLYRRWKKGFAYARMEFREYSRRAFQGGDIRMDFLSVMPEGLDLSKLEFSSRRENESLALLEAAAYLAINKTTPLFMNGTVNRKNYEYKKVVSEISELKQGEVRDPIAHLIYEVFKDTNNQLFSEIFSGRDVFGYPKEKARHSESMPLEEVGTIVERVVEKLVEYFSNRSLSEREVDMIRDAVLALEAGTPLEKSKLIELLEIAARMRPDGPVIRSKLKEWKTE